MPIAPSQRAQRFIEIYATGEHSQAQAYKLAGYSNADNANAAKLAKKYAAEIAAHREKLGLAPIEDNAEALADPDRASLIAAQRKLHADAVASGNLAVQRASLRALERLLRKPGRPGRPTSEATPTTPQQTERMEPEEFESLVAAFLLPEDLEAIEATWGNDAPPWGRVSQTSAEAQ